MLPSCVAAPWQPLASQAKKQQGCQAPLGSASPWSPGYSPAQLMVQAQPSIFNQKALLLSNKKFKIFGRGKEKHFPRRKIAFNCDWLLPQQTGLHLEYFPPSRVSLPLLCLWKYSSWKYFLFVSEIIGLKKKYETHKLMYNPSLLPRQYCCLKIEAFCFTWYSGGQIQGWWLASPATEQSHHKADLPGEHLKLHQRQNVTRFCLN